MKNENDHAHEHAGHRHARLQGLIQDELRSLLRDDVNDPALADVRVTAVVLSVDYRHARVHFALTANSPTDRNRAERALARATAFFRARLADAIDLKRVPDLRFVFDGVAADSDSDSDRDRGQQDLGLGPGLGPGPEDEEDPPCSA